MKDKQFLKIIEHTYPVQKQAMYEDLKKELNLPDDAVVPAESCSVAVQKPASKWHNFFKKPARLAACISAATAVVCLAIILPFTLNNDGGLQDTTPNPTPNPPQTSASTDRFIKAEECEEIEIKYSIKEYSELNNLSLFYINWYDIAESKTSLHVDNEDHTDIVYFEEILVHKGTGSIVELYINHYRTRVDIVENYKKTCIYIYYPPKSHGLKVLWGYDTAEKGEHYMYTAQFLYLGYYYTLVLRYPMDENSIFELVDSMFRR